MNSPANKNLGRLAELVESDDRLASDLEAFDTVQRLVGDLRKMREEAGLTQKLVAKQLGITQGRVSQIESGLMEHAPNLETAVKFAAVCGRALTWTLAKKEEATAEAASAA